MSEDIAELKTEINRLNKRLKKLGREKGNLQMAVNLVSQIANVTGVENVVQSILEILVTAIGGSNISIFYQTESRWRYVDALGVEKWLDEPNDELVRNCIETKKVVRQKEHKPSTLTLTGFISDHEIWVYPLQVKGFFFGAIKLEGMAFEHAHYAANIDPFIHYSAIVLYHEISSLKKLTEAYHSVNLAREELEKSKEQFELAMKFANEGLYDWDLEQDTIYYSPVWKALLGYSDSEIKNEFSEWERLTREDHVKESLAMLQDVLNGKRDIFEMEFQMIHKDGHWVDILSRGNVIFDENGKGIRVVGTHIDISNIKKLEHDILESEEKYRTIMEATTDPTYICSKDYSIEFMNRAMIEWLGDDLTGQSCFSALHGLTEQCSWCKFNRVLEKEPFTLDFTSPRDNRRYSSSSSPIVHVDGSVSKLTVYHDITDAAKMEARLQQVQKLESIGNLAGGIAHDFNNILSPIIGLSELLHADTTEGSTEQEYLQEILTAGKRGADLVQQILSFSRHSSDKKESVNIQKIITEVEKLCRATIPSDIDIKVKMDMQCGRILANQVQLHQVAMNLVTNAYHAVELQSGNISISLKEVHLEREFFTDNRLVSGKYAVLSVADNGGGISPDVINKIFDPYFTTKEQGKGTGLGLSTVYGIVKGIGGDIKVYSELGEGSIFNVYLPVIEVDVKTTQKSLDSPIPGGHEHILLVDDEVSLLKLGRRILEKLGYRVTALSKSTEALELFRDNPEEYDLVITDMTMPKMTGDKLTKAILSIRQSMKIIICTGFSERLNKLESDNLGVQGFLMKPFVRKDLAQLVRTVLDLKP